VKFNPKGLIATAAWILVLVTALKTQTAGPAGALRVIRTWLPILLNHL
jgi:hypothetical protein